MKPNAAQIRAAIGLLNLENADLARACGVTDQTISNIRRGVTRPQPRVITQITRVLELYGIEFLENSGLRLKSDSVETYEGLDGFRKLMDEVYLAACDPSAADGSKPICICNVDDRLFVRHLGDYMNFHVRRMNDLRNIRVRILVMADSFYAIQQAQYIDYRWNPQRGAGMVPFYVYGDRLAILFLEHLQNLKIIVLQSPLAAKAYREQFAILWQLSPEKLPTGPRAP